MPAETTRHADGPRGGSPVIRGYPVMAQAGGRAPESSRMRELGGDGRGPDGEAVGLLRGTGAPALKP